MKNLGFNSIKYLFGTGIDPSYPITQFVDLDNTLNISIQGAHETLSKYISSVVFYGEVSINYEALLWLIPRLLIEGTSCYILGGCEHLIMLPTIHSISSVKQVKPLCEKSLITHREKDFVLIVTKDIEELKKIRKYMIKFGVKAKALFHTDFIKGDTLLSEGIHDLYPYYGI